MYHYSNAIQDTKGNALIGFFTRCVDINTNEVAPLYSDKSGTPIENASGRADMAKVNSDGNAQFFVADGEYHIDIYATNGTEFIRRIDNIPMSSIGMLKAETKADVAAAATSYPVVLMEEGQEGIFIFRSTDQSLQVTSDPEQNTFIAPTSDDTGASGAWVRSGSQTVQDSVENSILSGCAVAYRELLIFDLSSGRYVLDGIEHTAAQQSVTLDAADGDDPRIDVLYLDAEGTFQKLTGTPAASPSKPALDPTAGLELTFVLVPANAVDLSEVTTENIYLENTEWTTSQSAASLNLASTTDPFAGTVCIRTTGVFATGQYLNFARASNLAFGGDGNLIFRIKPVNSSWGKRTMQCQFYCDGATVGTPVPLRHGAFGLDIANTSSYQVVIVPKSLFAIPAHLEIDALRITSGGTGNVTPNLGMDNIQLQTNGTAIGNSDLTQSIADARYVNADGDEMTGALLVPDEAYHATNWNGSRQVPTKNAVRDAIESVAAGVPVGGLEAANNLSDVANAATSAENLGLGITDTPQFAAINLGHASDTTLSRTGAGDIAVEGNAVYRAGGTDVPVADGGTGASSAAAAATNLGLGTGDSPQFTAINLGHATDTTLTRTGAGDIAVEGNAVYRAGGTDVPVADGGTGASTAAAARTNLGAQARSPAIQTVTSSATVTPTFDDDQVNITAQAAGLTLANPTGTAIPAFGMVIRIKDNGTARSIAYGSEYRAIGLTLPTTTVISKTLYLAMIYNSTDTKWDVVAVAQEA